MAQSRHYLKIPYTIAPWVPGGAQGDWRAAVHADVAANGELVLEHLSANHLGARSAIHGDRYCIEIGRDRDRRDCVFLMRIEPAEDRLPRSTPLKLRTRLELWPGGYPPDLDRVDHLFDQVDDMEEDPRQQVEEASPLLLSSMASVPESLRRRLAPGTDMDEPDDPHQFLQSLRLLWARHRLDRHVEVSPRQDMLLRTATTPPALSRSERDALLEAFGLKLLNRVALEGETQVRAVVESLAAIAISSALRAELWAASLQSLGNAQLRRELHASAGAVRRLVALDGVRGDAWAKSVVPHLRRLADRADEGLRDVLARVNDDRQALAEVAAWASGLAFSDETPPTATVTDSHGRLEHAPPNAASTVADEWVMKLRLPAENALADLREALVSAARELEARTDPLASVESLFSFDVCVAALSERSAAWREAVGEMADVEADLAECRSALAELEAVLGKDAEAFIRTNFVLPVEALEIARLLPHPLLRGAPEWLLSADVDAEQPARPETAFEWAQVLIQNERRRLLQMFCDLATELNEPQAVAWLPPLNPGDPPERHLREWFERVRTFLQELPVELRGMLSIGTSDLASTQAEAERLGALKAIMPDHFWTEVERELHEAGSAGRMSLVQAYTSAVNFLRHEMDGWEAMPYDLVKARAARELSRSAQTVAGPEPANDSPVTVEHNYLEGRASRATLVFAKSETGEDYGTVVVPLVLESEQPRAIGVRLLWDFKGDVRAGWSRDWPGPYPGDADVLSIPVPGWRRQPEGTRYHYCVKARLPIRTPRTANPRVEASVTVVEADTGRPLGPARVLKWESIALKPVSLSVAWGDATEPRHVREHPIGPQERAGAILDRFLAGGSVAVIAPRRFGKSTLVEYLVAQGAKASLLIPPAAVCTKYKAPAGFDYESLWADVSTRLVDMAGCRIRHESSSPLPTVEAFDGLRAEARKKGYKAVVILMDEAQLFFTGRKAELGSQLKSLVERDLARTDDAGKVPVVFGLIGLPSLRERAGADFMGLLNPIEKSRMDEAELRPLISKMTTGLQTTRGARQKLAETAGNLLILRALLERLAVRATREHRTWVSYDDVAAVEDALKADLQNGAELTVATYVRDVLNASDSVDDWRPLPSLPVAAAWARTWAPGRPHEDVLGRTLDLLNQWCKSNHSGEAHGVRPVYTRDLVKRHLDGLRERRVLDGAEFSSPLLQAWLTGLLSRGAMDEPFRDALFSGAQRRIKVPSGAAPSGRGGEAEIFLSGGFAYRIRKLPGELERRQFLEGIEMLDALRQVVHRREAGSDHIFDLVDMGLSDKDDCEGIQVYRWVEGQSLELRQGGLAAETVIDIGVKLARAVRLLHRNGVLHRDICPRNVVLDDVSDPSTIRPVLIDFGFARLTTAPMRTAITGEHIAPEVRGPRPEWGKPADIYALGATLKSLLDAGDSAPDLVQLLTTTQAETADARPTADHLLDALQQLETDRRISERREDAWREIWELVRDHRYVPWFSAQMNKTRESLVNVALRQYRSPMHRHGVVADFVNQLTEACPLVKRPLSAVGLRLNDVAVKTLGAIRNHHVHGKGNQLEEQRVLVQRFAQSSPDDQKALILSAIAKVGDACQLTALPNLGMRLLG